MKGLPLISPFSSLCLAEWCLAEWCLAEWCLAEACTYAQIYMPSHCRCCCCMLCRCGQHEPLLGHGMWWPLHRRAHPGA